MGAAIRCSEFRWPGGRAPRARAEESRNRLQRIQVAAGMARLGAEDNPQVQKQLDIIERSSEEIGELLAEVRNFAAPLNLDKMPSDLAGLWQEAWAALDGTRRSRVAKLREANSLPSKCA